MQCLTRSHSRNGCARHEMVHIGFGRQSYLKAIPARIKARLLISGMQLGLSDAKRESTILGKYLLHCPSRVQIMRISEILFWSNERTLGNRSDPQPDLPPTPFSDELKNLANAFTRRGLVKHLWNPYGWEGQPSGPPPPDGGNELIPSGTLQPTTASWEAEPVEKEPPVGQHRLVPFRQYRGISGG
jgi:hypothetical protein